MKSTALSARQIADLTAAQIPVLGYGFFYWPCIVGETFPPTFTFGSDGGAQYIRQGPFPAVSLGSGPSGSTAIRWPFLPLYRPGNTEYTGFTVSFRLFIPSAQFIGDVAVEVSVGGATVSIQTFATGFITVVGSGSNIPFIPQFQTWSTYTLVFAPSGLMTATIDGNPPESLLGTAPVDAPQVGLVARPNPAGTAVADLTTLTFAYT